MNDRIVTLITELAASGGDTAIWLYGLYVAGTVAKFIVGFGCILLGIRKICKTIILVVENCDEK